MGKLGAFLSAVFKPDNYCYACLEEGAYHHDDQKPCVVRMRKRIEALEKTVEAQAKQLKRFEAYFPAIR
jgi:hypothetical protein